MPQFKYRGRDSDGLIRTGVRTSPDIDALNQELLNEGITTINIAPVPIRNKFWSNILNWITGDKADPAELAIFARQMQLLTQAGVPITTSLLQLSEYMRSASLRDAIKGVIELIEKGQNLASAMQQFPDAFSPLMVNVIRIGEQTGHLSESFAHLHTYLAFEASSIKQIKAAFRYPIFVLSAVIISMLVLNIFVIPSFARFYSGANFTLPWQTRLLIGISNFIIHQGLWLLTFIIIAAFALYRYLQTEEGSYKFGRWLIHLPIFGKLIRRIILIRFSETMAIMLNAGIGVTNALSLVRDMLQNRYITQQIINTQEMIERGNTFSQSIAAVDLFSHLELQIMAVGEKNGEIGSALQYIGDFHANEIEFDLKRMNDIIGPLLIAIVSLLILLIALGIYLPVWNMVSSTRS